MVLPNFPDLIKLAKVQIDPKALETRWEGVENIVKGFDVNFVINVIKYLRGEESGAFFEEIKNKVREKDKSLGERKR